MFFARWREQHVNDWPRVPDYVIHHKLRRPVERFCRFVARHQEDTRFPETIMARHNSLLPAARAFGIGGGDCDSDRRGPPNRNRPV